MIKKYFRRILRPTNPLFSIWHEVDEKTAVQSVKLGIPRHSWDQIKQWFEEGIVLGNAYGVYRKCSEKFIKKINGVAP